MPEKYPIRDNDMVQYYDGKGSWSFLNIENGKVVSWNNKGLLKVKINN